MSLTLLFLTTIARGALFHISGTGPWGDNAVCGQLSAPCQSFNAKFAINSGDNDYSFGVGTFVENATNIDMTTTTLKGTSEQQTWLDLSPCNSYLFQVSSGYLYVDHMTFSYNLACAHTIVTVTDAGGYLNFTNVTVSQGTTYTQIASSIFNIAGHGIFTNTTLNDLKLNNAASTFFAGSPVELFFNYCTIANVNFTASTGSACLVKSIANAVSKTYYFNKTSFVNISLGGSSTGGLFYFNSSVPSIYTFDNCNFTTLPIHADATGGILYAETVGNLNITQGIISTTTGGKTGCLICTKIGTSYIARSTIDNVRSFSGWAVYVQTGTLSITSSSFSNLFSTSTCGVYCAGTALTIMGTNFTHFNGSGEGLGVYMTNAAAFLTMSDIEFYDLNGTTRVCIWTNAKMSATKVLFSNAKASSGSGVGLFTSVDSTLIECIFEYLTATSNSGSMYFSGSSNTATWNSCIFRHLHSNSYGGMCCQSGTILADNNTCINCTSDGMGGVIHYHAGTATFTRCLFYNNTAKQGGGALYLGASFLVANCEFGGNYGGAGTTYYTDLFTTDTSKATVSTVYGCCSTSVLPRIAKPELINDCTFTPLHVNMSGLRGGINESGCGTDVKPCLTLSYMATTYAINTPLYIRVDYGTFPEGFNIPVYNRHIMINGTTDIVGTEVSVYNDSLAVLFTITTGTFTCNRLRFVQSRGTLQRSMIYVEGIGTMTIRDCTFSQSGASLLRSAIVSINNPTTICVFQGCNFTNVAVEDNSTMYITAAKSVSVLNCQFLNHSSVNGTTNVAQAGGAISSTATLLTVTVAVFQQCTTTRNGGAIYFAPGGSLSLSEITFDRCMAVSGGALYISRTGAVASDRFMFRCFFLNNVASNKTQAGSNDIRDLNANTASWTGGNAIECCSISDYRKFSVNANTDEYDHFLPVCFKNPCLDYTASTCPPECDNSTGSCIPTDCTRLHYETSCTAACTMYDGWCIPDVCFPVNVITTCEANHECIWDYPNSTTTSMGVEVIPPSTMVCQAEGECTRPAGVTNCTKVGCTLDQGNYCVPDKCNTTGSSISDCPQDCDWTVSGTVGTCKSTPCTRQGNETTCKSSCILETNGTYSGRCTVDICAGRNQAQCTTECQWLGGKCQPHECTTLHNETTCKTGCQKDKQNHCVKDPCYNVPITNCPSECAKVIINGVQTCNFTNCVRLNNETTCDPGCQNATALDACIVDPCISLKTETLCNQTDCTWNTVSNKCEYNNCTRLLNEPNCYTGCQKDPRNHCVLDICYYSTNLVECGKTDCDVVGSMCVYNNCTRLHNETLCYDGCVKDLKDKCVKDPCPEKLSQLSCEAIDCLWVGGKCVFNECVRLYNETVCYPGCKMDPKDTCVKDPCPTYQTSPNCIQHDCTWNSNNTCTSNDCTRLRNETSCYSGCVPDSTNVYSTLICVKDPCASLNELQCNQTDCTWNTSIPAKCQYNNCVRLHNEATCYQDCQLDPAGHCVEDVCVGLNIAECHPNDCVWNNISDPAKCVWTNCTRLHGESDCYNNCKKDQENICTRDTCVNLTKNQCDNSDCTWTGSNICVTNDCVRLYEEINCYTHCYKDPQGFCAADPCENITVELECNQTDCVWNNAAVGKKCVANNCTRLHNLPKGSEGCYDNCYLDPDGTCVLNPCTSKNQSACEESDCLWKNGQCEYDQCVRLRGETDCSLYDDSAGRWSCKMDPQGRCRKNPCTGLKQSQCPSKDCTWNLSTSACDYNNCTRLNSETDCYLGNYVPVGARDCYKDPVGLCIQSPCIGLSETACEANGTSSTDHGSDCKWINNKCTHPPNNCVRLHNETTCYSGCQLNPDYQCVPDICLSISVADCPASDCILNGSICQYNKCVRLEGEPNCDRLPGCEQDPKSACRPDPCPAKTTQISCEAADCTWNAAAGVKCSYNPCVRLNGEPNCDDYHGSALPLSNRECWADQKGVCIHSPCDTSPRNESESNCRNTDCSWVNGKCTHNDCVRLHNEIKCYPHCQLDQKNVCVNDVCDSYRDSSMSVFVNCNKSDCTWNSNSTTNNASACQYNPCVRLHGETGPAPCYPGCQLNASENTPKGICYPDPCYNLTTEDQCTNSDCLWNKGNNTCNFYECVRLNNEPECPIPIPSCVLDPLGYCARNPCYDYNANDLSGCYGSECTYIPSVSCTYDNCVRLHNESKCYENCVKNNSANLTCISDPCLRYGTETQCQNSDCSWNVTGNKCQANGCTRLYYTQSGTAEDCTDYHLNNVTSCILVNNKCIPDICNKLTTESDCLLSDCTWNTTASKCEYNLCVRLNLPNDTECPSGCIFKQVNGTYSNGDPYHTDKCVVNPCVTKNNAVECEQLPECIWLLSNWTLSWSGTCMYNLCSEKTPPSQCNSNVSDTTSVNPKCQNDTALKCVPDICVGADTEDKCFVDCNWNNNTNTCSFTECVRSHYSPTCENTEKCEMHLGKACKTNPCLKYDDSTSAPPLVSAEQCELHDCKWDSASANGSRCVFTNCTRFLPSEDCSDYVGCKLDNKTACVLDVCYVAGNNSGACNQTDCIWNGTTNSCEYHDCVRLHEETDCYTGCIHDRALKCTRDICLGLSKDQCESSECTWNTSLVTPKCEVNSCTRLHDEPGCYIGCVFSVKHPDRCVSNPCYNEANNIACLDKSCTWNTSSIPPGVCEYNPCVPLENDTVTDCLSYSGCQIDQSPNPRCVKDPCPELYGANCVSHDCNWNAGKCEYTNCTRLHNENGLEDCFGVYPHCALDPAGVCVPEPCTAVTAKSECETFDCIWNNISNKCEYYHCVRLHEEEDCDKYNGCVLDLKDKCVPDPCPNILIDQDCKDRDCTWKSPNKCEYNKCVRLPSEANCTEYPECQLDYAGICVHDPCPSKKASECTNSDCEWNDSTNPKKCDWNSCVRLHNETDCTLYPGCKLDPKRYCAKDPCSKPLAQGKTQADCQNEGSIDCTWYETNKTCGSNMCVRLYNESDCSLYPGCELNKSKACEEDVCKDYNGNRVACGDHSMCFYNRTQGTSCEYNPCVYQYDDTTKECFKNTPDNCVKDYNNTCIPYTCNNSYLSQSPENCSPSPECVWDYSTGKCTYNYCVNQHYDNGTCTNETCVQNNLSICVPDVCRDYNQREICEKAVECRWNLTTGGCDYNPCVTRKNEAGGCISTGGLTCVTSINGTCVPDKCRELDRNETLCLSSNECVYNYASEYCLHNECVEYTYDETACKGAQGNNSVPCVVADTSHKCIPNLCVTGYDQDKCSKAYECIWSFGGTGGNCEYNPCVTVNHSLTTGICTNTSTDTCVTTETPGVCVPDNCHKITIAATCQSSQAMECIFEFTVDNITGNCVHNPCIGKYIPPANGNPLGTCSQQNVPSGCHLSQVDLNHDFCIPNNTCAKYNGKEDICKSSLLPECLYLADGACVYNPCVASRDAQGDCLEGCALDYNVNCVPNLCGTYTNFSTCEREEICFVNTSSNSCEYNPCISKHGNLGDCLRKEQINDPNHPDLVCVHDAENLCVPDGRCETYTNTSATNCTTASECVWNYVNTSISVANVCERNPCLELTCPSTTTNFTCNHSSVAGVCIPIICDKIESYVDCDLVPSCMWNPMNDLCKYNPCFSQKIENTTLPDNTVCKLSEDPGILIPDDCSKYNKTQCSNATECILDHSTNSCTYNPCIGYRDKSNGSCKNISSPTTKCVQGTKGKSKDICIPEDICSKYNTDKTKCEDELDGNCWLKVNESSTTCVVNPCSTKHDTVGNCLKDNKDKCELNFDGFCYPDNCSVYDTNYSSCLAEPMCQWIAKSTVSPGECEYNPCVSFHDENRTCTDNTCYLDDHKVCVKDLCDSYSLDQSGCNNAVECLYGETSEKCVLNPCIYQLDTNKKCIIGSGCQEDRAGLCVPDICYNITYIDCERSDCTWNGTNCEYNECVRLHEETDCFEDKHCVKSPVYESCVVDPCLGLLEKPCIDRGCDWNGTCNYHPCVPLHDEKECYGDKCLADFDDHCFPDICVNKTTKEDCPIDCIWKEGDENINPTCKSSSCTRLHDEPNCNPKLDCVISPVNKGCAENPCGTAQTADECFVDCNWAPLVGSSPPSCNYNPCVRLHGEEECYDGCVMFEDTKCVVDPCANQTVRDCSPECVVIDDKCQASTCTRLNNEPNCAPGCVKDSLAYCVPEVCNNSNEINLCPSGCKHNTANLTQCVVDPCSLRNFSSCALATSDAGGPCVYIDDHCESRKECNLTSFDGNCRDGCVDESGSLGLYCIPDPCANISPENVHQVCASQNACGLNSKDKCRSKDECTDIDNPSICLNGCMPDLNAKCQKDLCPQTGIDKCLENDYCVLLGNNHNDSKTCIWNDCLEKPSNMNADSKEDAGCGVGCQYVSTSRRCEPDDCRPNNDAECPDVENCKLIGPKTSSYTKANMCVKSPDYKSPPSKKKASSFPWWIIVVIAAVLAIVAAIIAILLLKRKKKPIDDFDFAVDVDLKDGEGLDIDGVEGGAGADFGFGAGSAASDVKKSPEDIDDQNDDDGGDDNQNEDAEDGPKKKKGGKNKRNMDLTGLDGQDPEAYKNRQLDPELDINFGEADGLQFGKLTLSQLLEPLDKPAKKGKKKKGKKGGAASALKLSSMDLNASPSTGGMGDDDGVGGVNGLSSSLSLGGSQSTASMTGTKKKKKGKKKKGNERSKSSLSRASFTSLSAGPEYQDTPSSKKNSPKRKSKKVNLYPSQSSTSMVPDIDDFGSMDNSTSMASMGSLVSKKPKRKKSKK